MRTRGTFWGDVVKGIALSGAAIIVACTVHSTTITPENSGCTPGPTCGNGNIQICPITGVTGACTAKTLQTPDGQVFRCASCDDCAQATLDAERACGVQVGSSSGRPSSSGYASSSSGYASSSSGYASSSGHASSSGYASSSSGYASSSSGYASSSSGYASSSSSGSPTCTLAAKTGNAGCDSCLQSNCCQQVNGCFNVQDCVDLDTCLANCFSDAGATTDASTCENACAQAHPNSTSLFSAVGQCIKNNCSSTCQ